MAASRYGIADELRKRVMSGQYPEGKKLPGNRALADEFEVAQNTVSAAVRLLADEGLVVIKSRSGVVAHPSGVVESTTTERINSAREDLEAIRDDVHAIEKRIGDALSRLDS